MFIMNLYDKSNELRECLYLNIVLEIHKIPLNNNLNRYRNRYSIDNIIINNYIYNNYII